MDDFDRWLELALHRLLDPIVAGRPPPRRHRPGSTRRPPRVKRGGIAGQLLLHV